MKGLFCVHEGGEIYSVYEIVTIANHNPLDALKRASRAFLESEEGREYLISNELRGMSFCLSDAYVAIPDLALVKEHIISFRSFLDEEAYETVMSVPFARAVRDI